MDVESVRDYCIRKSGTSESFPFDETTLVFKITGKMFALIDLEKAESINLKCNPEKAGELRERYAEITPGYHMNKKHWNTVQFTGSLSDQLIEQLIDESYNLVRNSLPARIRKDLP